MKILILGGTGFVGKNLAIRCLSEGHSVTIVGFKRTSGLHHKNLREFQIDLRLSANVDSLFATDIYGMVYHCAAVTSGAGDIVNSPAIHVTDNAVMTSLILRRFSESESKHFVYLSCTVFLPNGGINVDEEVSLSSDMIDEKYFGVGITKRYIEDQMKFYSRVNKKQSYTVLRLTNVYGPHDKYDLARAHVTGASISKIVFAPTGSNVEVWGDGSEKRDLLYVDDLIELMLKLLAGSKLGFDVFNVGTGKSVSVRELINTIISLEGRSDITLSYNLSRPTIPFHIDLNFEKVRSHFLWCPRFELRQGLASSIKWLKGNNQNDLNDKKHNAISG